MCVIILESTNSGAHEDIKFRKKNSKLFPLSHRNILILSHTLLTEDSGNMHQFILQQQHHLKVNTTNFTYCFTPDITLTSPTIPAS